MKKFGWILFLFAFISVAQAQEEDNQEIRTIVDGKITSIGAFGGPKMSFTTFDHDYAFEMGGGGGIILNHKLFFGGYGMGLTTDVNPSVSEFANYTIDFEHGGFWFGYIVNHYKPIHPSISLQAGWGNIVVQDEFFVNVRTDNVFVFNPIAELEINMTKFFKMGVGANFRMVLDENFVEYESLDFSSPGVFVSFKFGAF